MLGMLQRLAKAVTSSSHREETYLTPARAALIAVDRAIRDMRAGLPVFLVTEHQPSGLLIQAAECMTPASYRWLQQESTQPPELLLSPERAHTLHLPAQPVWLQTQSLTPETIAAIADPTLPQENMISFAAQTHITGREHHLANAAVALVKYAELLPVLLTASMRFSSQDAMHQWLAATRVLRVSRPAIESYLPAKAQSLQQVSSAQVPLQGHIPARVVSFRPASGGLEQLAILIGEPEKQTTPVSIRLHSSCLTGDIFGSMRCDCGAQFRKAIEDMQQEGHGVVLYLQQEGRGIGITNKLKAYELQDHGHDTFDANEMLGYAKDERRFMMAAEMLKQLGIRKVRLMTNNPQKLEGLIQAGIDVVDRIAHIIPPNGVNDAYLKAKADKGGHLLQHDDTV